MEASYHRGRDREGRREGGREGGREREKGKSQVKGIRGEGVGVWLRCTHRYQCHSSPSSSCCNSRGTV